MRAQKVLRVGLAVVAAIGAVSGGDASCPLAHDPHSNLASSLLAYTGLHTHELLNGVPLPSSFSACVGSLDAATLMQAGSSVLETPTCFRAIDWLATASSSQPSSSAAGLFTSAGFASLTAMDATYFDDLCTPMADVLPCLRRALLPTLMPILSAEPCCASLLDDSTAQFGASFDSFVVDALSHVVDVVCSTQSPGFNDKSQPCGYSLLASVLTASSNNLQQLAWTVLNAVQLPNDQGIAGVTGGSITSTRNVSMTLFLAPTVPDACAAPIDALLEWAKDLPIVASTAVGADLTLAALFQDNQCVPGGLALAALVESFPQALSGDLYTMVSAILTDDDVCFHLANGYASGSDRFQTTVTTFTQSLGGL